MSQPARDKIRNIGIISHIDAGKTTVSERILYYCGEIHKLGEVHDGMATMDWMSQEQDRGITITATSTTCRWQDIWINLIDTPGHIDFTIEVERSLRVLDGAVTIFSAVEGVQPQSESVWHQADRYHVPRICLINKMDRVGADYRTVLKQMTERLGARPVLMQLPVGEEGDFKSLIDLVDGCELTFDEGALGAAVACVPIAEEHREKAAAAREAIVEAAADWDDELLADFLDGKPVAAPRIRQALRKGVLANALFPVFLGSALRNRGVQPVLDAVKDLLPSPLDMPPVPAHPSADAAEEVLLDCDPDGPLCALAFKVLSDEGRKLTYLRLYSGQLKAGETVLNTTRHAEERVARLFRMHAHKRERIDLARAGDIVAAAGLKEALTGDTLCSARQPLLLAGLTVPEPVVSLAVEPKHVQDRDKLLQSLEKLQWEDPTFWVREDPDTGQMATYLVTADEVTYYDGGRWPNWADGQGASLELRDPRSDNDTPDAWADSDESVKSTWEPFSFTIEANDTRYTHDQISVFGLMLLNRGEVLLDDLSLSMGRGNILTNSGFEIAEANWRRLGNHVRSFATTEDSRSG
ncbi:MAG: elongation factor G, partial [Desulfuromonadales bacterium]